MRSLFRILSICVLLAVFAAVFTACGSGGSKKDDVTVNVSESSAATADTAAQTKESTDLGDLTAEEMEIAVHNSFSDSFSKTINESDIFSMKMYSEGNNVVWGFTFKEHHDEATLLDYKEKIVDKDLTQNLEALRAAVKSDISNTGFGMIVRYYTAEGDLLLEQTAW